jgi:hypothetical protein
MKYDDGFVAYLNGNLIASENSPASLVWNSDATGGHPDTEAINFVTFEVSAHVGKLVEGTNILAIHGLNDGIGSSDFLISPELEVGQSTVSNGLVLNESVLITARTRDGSDWSAPAEAYFLVDTIPASAKNLFISEFHYRPADANATELAAGFTDRDDFEFIELMNRGSQTINLSGVEFIDGVTFDFSTAEIRSLAPGTRVLIVKNLAAFEQRYGSKFSSQIAGEYSGNLSNDGELITLVDATGSNILSFTYNDQSPWPEEPDGDSYTLVLISPTGQPIPEHGDPSSWRASASPGGSPGDTGSSNYNDWKIANGLPIPETDADPDRDGRDNLLEYFEGTNPNSSDLASGTIAIESLTLEGIANDYIVFRFRRNLTADDVSLAPQISDELNNWLEGPANIVLHERTRISDTEENLVFRSTSPSRSESQKFGRLKLQLK